MSDEQLARPDRHAQPAEPVGPLVQAGDEIAAAELSPVSGSRSGSLRIRSSTGSTPHSSASLSSADSTAKFRAPRREPGRSRGTGHRGGQGGGYRSGSRPRTSFAFRSRTARRTRSTATSARTRRAQTPSGPVRLRAETDALDRRRAVPRDREHLAAGQRDLGRSASDHRRHRRDDQLRPRRPF